MFVGLYQMVIAGSALTQEAHQIERVWLNERVKEVALVKQGSKFIFDAKNPPAVRVHSVAGDVCDFEAISAQLEGVAKQAPMSFTASVEDNANALLGTFERHKVLMDGLVDMVSSHTVSHIMVYEQFARETFDSEWFSMAHNNRLEVRRALGGKSFQLVTCLSSITVYFDGFNVRISEPRVKVTYDDTHFRAPAHPYDEAPTTIEPRDAASKAIARLLSEKGAMNWGLRPLPQPVQPTIECHHARLIRRDFLIVAHWARKAFENG